MAGIVEFLQIAYDFMENLEINLGAFSFTFMDILKIEIIVLVCIKFISLIFHFGSTVQGKE